MNYVFFTVIAWPIAIMATLVVLFRVLYAWTYIGSFQETQDNISNKKQTFPITLPFILAFISWAWIFTN